MSGNQSTKTIFQAGSNWLSEWSAGNRERFSELASQRNDAHHYDEALLFVRGVLWICILITLGFGVYFHYSIFSAAGGNTWIAVAASLLLFLVAEVLKVVFGQYTLQGLVNGVAFKMPITNFLLTICFATLTVGAFLWSIHISTSSVESVNLALNTAKLHKEQPFVAPASIATLDAQIAAADAASAKAQKSTWKKRPTAEGLAVMQGAETTKQALIAQRKTEWDAAWSAYQASLGEQGKVLGMSASTLGMIGGNAEYVAAFLLLIIALLKNKCYHENKKILEDKSADAQNVVATTPTPNPQDLTSTIEDAMRKILAGKQPIIVSGFKQNPTGSAPTPPLPVSENRGNTVATTSHNPTEAVGPTISHNSHTFIPEVVEDIEGKVVALCDRFKKEWPKRWRDRVASKGDLTTMQTNFTQFYTLLNTYLESDHKPLSHRAQGRVAEFRSAYVNEILPTITPN